MRRLSGSARAATAMLVVLALGWASVAPVQAVPSATPSLDAPTVVAPRLAFTDDSDELVVRAQGGYCTNGSCVADQTVVWSDGDHTGEASATRYTPPPADGEDAWERDGVTYVSAVDDAAGEVYLRDVDGSPGDTVRVTCNSDIESHPVLSPDGRMVAYASQQSSGAWQIWVAWLRADDDEEAMLDCADMPRVQVTSVGSNTWPTWIGSERLAFSSNRTDPLGDLYAVRLGGRAAPVSDADTVQLSSGPAAETQPTALTSEQDGLLVFTTTEFRFDGSLAGMRLAIDDGGAVTSGAVVSLWPAGPPQSSEPAFDTEASASFADPYPSGQVLRLGFTSMGLDPHGDVFATSLTPQETATSGGTAAAADPALEFGWGVEAGDTRPVSREPGRSESHIALAHDGNTAVVVNTRSAHSADVSDVVAADGSDRRTVASEEVSIGEGDVRARDESAPTYSPDGSRIAYSRTTPAGREIVTAAADGSDIQALLTDRPSEAIDLEPAWSPDGTRIAFVRADLEARGASEVWVASVPAGTATKLTLPATTTRSWDESPSWSPDGARVVVARRVVSRPDVEVTLAAPTAAIKGTAFAVPVTIRNIGEGTTGPDAVTVVIRASQVGDEYSFALASADQRCVASEGSIQCDLGVMPPGGSESVAVTATPKLVGAGVISAEAVSTADDLDPTNDMSASTVLVAEAPNVRVSLDMPPDVGYRKTETLTLSVENAPDAGLAANGRVDLVADQAASDGLVEFTLDQADCTRDTPSRLHCDVAPLRPGETATFVVGVIGVQGGTATVTAQLVGVEGDVSTDDDRATGTTPVQPPPTSTTTVPPPTTTVPPPTTSTFPPPTTFTFPPPTTFTQPPIIVGRSHTRDSLAPSPVVRRPVAIRDLATAPVPNVPTQLWVLDASTGEGEPVVLASGDLCSSLHPCRPPAVKGRVPAWSPDGLRIAYEQSGVVSVLVLVDLDGNGVADEPERAASAGPVTGFHEDGTPTSSRATISAATDPAWSPDGSELAITGQPAGLPAQQGIYVVRLDGTSLREVAQDRGPETEPAWQPFADIGVELVAVPAAGDIGFATDITATVTNSGPTPARGLKVLVEFPAGVDHGPPPPGCTFTERVLTCDVALLVPGASTPFAIAATVATEGGHSVTATVDATAPDPRPTNNIATVLLTASTVLADLGVTLSASPADGLVGFDSVLEARVTNNGPREVLLATVRMVLPPGLTGGSAPIGCVPSGPVLTCGLAGLAPGSTDARRWPVRGAVVGAHVVSADVSSSVPDPVTANNVAQATVTVGEALADLSVTVTTTTPGYVGGSGTTTVTVRNLGPQPVTDASLTVTHAPATVVALTGSLPCFVTASPCAVPALPAGASTTFTAPTSFEGPGSGDVTAAVTSSLRDPAPGNNRARRPLVVKQPTLRLSPEVVAPGGVTVVTGRDFPPGTRPGFAWSIGILPSRALLTVRPDGTFAVQVVVLRRDPLGLRELTASGSIPGQFTPVTAELLVAPRNMSPPLFVERN